MKKMLAILLATLMLAAVFVGCAPKGTTGTTGGTTGSTTGTTNAKVRDVARFPLGGEVTTLIGGDNISTNNTIPIMMIHDRLFEHNADGTIGSNGLAKSWEISTDGLTYTIHLQQGVKWHDGTDFTADDAVFSIDLFKKGTNEQATAGTYIDHAEKVDANTVKMILKAPYAPILAVWGRDGYVYSKHHYEVTCKGDYNVFNLSPCGTGPYKYVSYKSGQGMTLQYNENYWNKGVLPKNPIKNVELRVISDTNAVQTALETDSLDFAGVAISIPAENYDYFSKNDKFQVTKGGSTMTWYCPINAEKFPDAKVRQAMAYAVDRKFIIDLMDAGNGTVANTLPGKKSFGYTEQKPYDFDVAKAKALLKESGHENGAGIPEVQIVARPDRKTGGEALQSMWNEIGIKSKVDVQESTTYLSEIKKGNFGASIISQTVALDVGGTIENFSDPAKGASMTRWYDATVWDQLQKANAATDSKTRMDYFTKAFTAIHDAVPMIFLFYDTKLYVHRANLALGSTYVDPPALRFFECYWLPDGQKAPAAK